MFGAAFALLLTFQEPDQSREVFKVEYYDVEGVTATELRAEVMAKGPRSKTGRWMAGYTTWGVSWTYQYHCPKSCVVTQALTGVQIVMTLPRWKPPSHASPDLKMHWERFLAALRLHEDGHADIAREARDAVRSRLLDLGEFADAGALSAAVQKTGDQTIAEFVQRNTSYDLRTAHGVAQGVMLP